MQKISINEYNQVYGKYSMGGCAILSDPNKVYDKIDEFELTESYKKSIQMDLERAGIVLNQLKEYIVLDVGTGRQTIAFHQLGAKKIHHYDISKDNVNRMNQYISSNSLHNKLESICVDLVKASLPFSYFDFVYLHGIVQHYSHTGQGLSNCCFWIYG